MCDVHIQEEDEVHTTTVGDQTTTVLDILETLVECPTGYRILEFLSFILYSYDMFALALLDGKITPT